MSANPIEILCVACKKNITGPVTESPSGPLCWRCAISVDSKCEESIEGETAKKPAAKKSPTESPGNRPRWVKPKNKPVARDLQAAVEYGAPADTVPHRIPITVHRRRGKWGWKIWLTRYVSIRSLFVHPTREICVEHMWATLDAFGITLKGRKLERDQKIYQIFAAAKAKAIKTGVDVHLPCFRSINFHAGEFPDDAIDSNVDVPEELQALRDVSPP